MMKAMNWPNIRRISPEWREDQGDDDSHRHKREELAQGSIQGREIAAFEGARERNGEKLREALPDRFGVGGVEMEREPENCHQNRRIERQA